MMSDNPVQRQSVERLPAPRSTTVTTIVAVPSSINAPNSANMCDETGPGT